jgi:hypothetical protein
MRENERLGQKGIKKLKPHTHATAHHPSAHKAARTLWNHAPTPNEPVVEPTAIGHHIVLQVAHAADHATAAHHVIDWCYAATSEGHSASASDTSLLALSNALLLAWRRL